MLVIPKYLLRLLPLLLLAIFSFSCDEEQLLEETTPALRVDVVAEPEMLEALAAALPPESAESPLATPETMQDPADGRRNCFRFVYPIEIAAEGGRVFTADDAEELWVIIRRLRAAGVAANFVYPLEVMLRNDRTLTISSFADFRRLQALCMENDGGDVDSPCLRYAFPIDLVIDGATVTVNDGQEWRRAVATAAEGAEISIVFPITVGFGGERIVVRNSDQLNRLRHICRNTDDPPCVRYVFPIGLEIDGEVVRVNNLLEWRRAAAAAGEGAMINIVFPIEVLFQGEQITLENVQQLRRVWVACGGPHDNPERPCVQYIFPIGLNIDGEVVRVNNLQQWRRAVTAAGEGAEVNIIYPIRVLFRGERITIENVQQLRRVWAACSGPHDNPDRPCLQYIFPIGLDIDGDTIRVNNLQEWRRATAAAGEGAEVSIIFPINVIFQGEQITLRNAQQLRRVWNVCSGPNIDEDRCFTYNFPVNLTVNGREITVNSVEEWARLRARAGGDAVIRLVLPVTVTIVDSGEEIVIAETEDWMSVREACR